MRQRGNEHKEERVIKHKGMSSSNSWTKNKEKSQTFVEQNNVKNLKNPCEKKGIEGDAQKYPPRKGGNKQQIKYTKGIQCYKCNGLGHMMWECPNGLNVLAQAGELYLASEGDQEECYEVKL